MSLALFDLDNTLLADDSDYLWGQFLVERGLVDREHYESANARFYEQYKQGSLDIVAFLTFALEPLARYTPEQLYAWRAEFVETCIKPVMLPAAQALIDKHRQRGDTLVVITATNRFVTAPIVALYGIEHLIATTPTFDAGRYTGGFDGVPCFQAGKVQRLQQWLEEQQADLTDSWFYSDSHNDLPLLHQVSHAVAVDPDDKLRAAAQAQGWPIISLRDGVCPEHHFAK